MKVFGKVLPGLALTLVGLLSLAPSAKATDVFQTYNLAWSGSSFGNGAIATGLMTLDLTTLPDPESVYTDIITSITSLTVTVSGSGAGDGIFTLADLAPDSDLGTYTYWFTNGFTVNMQGDVLAQLGTDGGDFNLFFAPPGPQGSLPLQLTTDALEGDPMAMTEFAPAIPEPGTSSLILIGLLGLVMVTRKRISQGRQPAN